MCLCTLCWCDICMFIYYQVVQAVSPRGPVSCSRTYFFSRDFTPHPSRSHFISYYNGTPFEKPPWWEATSSEKVTWQFRSKYKYIDFYPWREANLFWCKRGGVTRGVDSSINPKPSIHFWQQQTINPFIHQSINLSVIYWCTALLYSSTHSVYSSIHLLYSSINCGLFIHPSVIVIYTFCFVLPSIFYIHPFICYIYPSISVYSSIHLLYSFIINLFYSSIHNIYPSIHLLYSSIHSSIHIFLSIYFDVSLIKVLPFSAHIF